MSRLDEAKELISKMDLAIDKETDRIKKVMHSKRKDPSNLEEVSLYVAKLFKIKGALAITSSMIEQGDISNARWHKARRRNR
jgi:hypothetical protein